MVLHFFSCEGRHSAVQSYQGCTFSKGVDPPVSVLNLSVYPGVQLCLVEMTKFPNVHEILPGMICEILGIVLGNNYWTRLARDGMYRSNLRQVRGGSFFAYRFSNMQITVGGLKDVGCALHNENCAILFARSAV